MSYRKGNKDDDDSYYEKKQYDEDKKEVFVDFECSIGAEPNVFNEDNPLVRVAPGTTVPIATICFDKLKDCSQVWFNGVVGVTNPDAVDDATVILKIRKSQKGLGVGKLIYESAPETLAPGESTNFPFTHCEHIDHCKKDACYTLSVEVPADSLASVDVTGPVTFVGTQINHSHTDYK
ncbi:hypothetical protein [Priestia megaterium]|uniref:hypothetical protein n=1 Tax=Priestia megaterium TaxID=1404 RepID=UPI00398FD99A